VGPVPLKATFTGSDGRSRRRTPPVENHLLDDAPQTQSMIGQDGRRECPLSQISRGCYICPTMGVLTINATRE